eukprot:TCONS_00032578-protein
MIISSDAANGRKGAGEPTVGRYRQGRMVSGREIDPHQHSGAESCLTSHKDIHKRPEKPLSPSTARQSGSFSLCDKNGEANKPNPIGASKRDMIVSASEKDHSYSRVHPLITKQGSRLQVKELKGLGGLEIRFPDIPKNKTSMGNPRDRPLCVKNFSSSNKILQLEARSFLSSSGCTSTRLEPESTLMG